MINNQNIGVLSEKVAYLEGAVANATDASGISYDNTDSGLTATNVQAAIDEVIVDLSGYKHVEFRGVMASFSGGKATITHNLGKDNKIIPIATGGLIPTAVVNPTQNSFELQVVWATSANVADSPMATNYTGNFGIDYFLIY